MLCMKAPSRRSKVRETVKLPEEGHRERRQASRVWEQGKKAKPKATLDRTGSGQPSTIEDLEHERVRKQFLRTASRLRTQDSLRRFWKLVRSYRLEGFQIRKRSLRRQGLV
ncbi:Hypothetical_protein [Hexamita inflata]|uniref:Hypothetical_protein n=1 Tax=Hexamita inflata TaxID=28002 RepID=A0AA86N5N7_9EUKA|nr:Hypothetical protein HINF_LOCUS1107 [Hexamita inflata]